MQNKLDMSSLCSQIYFKWHANKWSYEIDNKRLNKWNHFIMKKNTEVFINRMGVYF